VKPRFSNQRNHALTITEVLVVIVVLVVLAIFILPVFYNPPIHAYGINCVNNVKQLDLAYYVWAGDHGGKYPMQISVTNGGTMELFSSKSRFQSLAFLNFLVMSNELRTPKVLYCPADTNSFAAANFSGGFNNQNVSYFIGLNAGINSPQTFLSGDDNFEIGGVPVKSGLLEVPTNTPITWTAARHKLRGNIGLADGSVQLINTSGQLQNALQQTGVATNRLAIP
jgi:prepilin-type processing-associated H-X9-DG protein